MFNVKNINVKQIFALGLCAVMLLGGSLAASAENEKPILISAPMETGEMFEFISFEGIVKEISEDGENLRVLVTNEEEEGSLTLNIGKTVLLV
jgi:hypothetical protein